MPKHASASSRYTLAAGATAVVIGAGFTVFGLSKGADALSPSADERPLTVATTAPAQPLADLIPPASPTSAAPTSAAPSSAAPTTVAPKPSTSKAVPASVRPKETTAKPKPTVTRTRSRAAAAAPATGGSVVDQVLAHINAARVEAGLGKLTVDAELSRAAALHNQKMIDGCGLSHQCPGESGLGERFSAQGVRWSAAGENIGYSHSGTSTAELVRAANGLTDDMLAEVPPNDGHRKNLLNKNFGRIGLSVVRGPDGVTWMTQDFVN